MTLLEARKAFLIMNEDEWGETPRDRKDVIIFCTLKDFHERMVSLERLNNFYAFVGGLVGGIIAILSYHFLLKL